MLGGAESKPCDVLGLRSAVATEQINRMQTRPVDVRHLGIWILYFFWFTDQLKNKSIWKLL